MVSFFSAPNPEVPRDIERDVGRDVDRGVDPLEVDDELSPLPKPAAATVAVDRLGEMPDRNRPPPLLLPRLKPEGLEIFGIETGAEML